MKTIKKLFASILSMLSATSAVTVSADVIDNEVDTNENTDNTIRDDAGVVEDTIADKGVEFDKAKNDVNSKTSKAVKNDTSYNANIKCDIFENHNTVYRCNTCSADNDYYTVGDANEDNKLDVRDAACIAKELSKNREDTLPISADYTQDELINVRDAAGVANYCADTVKAPVTTMPVTAAPAETMVITATTTTVTELTANAALTNEINENIDYKTSGTATEAHCKPVKKCTCDTTNVPSEEICQNCNIWLNCTCGALPIGHKLTTTPDAPVEDITEPVTTTVTDITNVTTETMIFDIPVETTVTTTSEPIETTTVTTTTQVVETTVAKKSIEDFCIIYNVSPIYEMHSLEYQTYVNKSLYFYELGEGLREWFQEEFKEKEDYDDDFGSYFRATTGINDQGSFTNMRLIGFNYTFYKAYTDDSKTEEITKEEIEKAIGYEVPDKFKSSMCLDGNTNTAVDVGITVDDYGFSCYPYGSTYVNMITLQKISPMSNVDLSSYIVDFANEENAVIFLNTPDTGTVYEYTIDGYSDYSNAIYPNYVVDLLK